MKVRAIARAEMRIDYVKLVILSGALVGSWAVFAPLVYAAARAFRTLIG